MYSVLPLSTVVGSPVAVGQCQGVSASRDFINLFWVTTPRKFSKNIKILIPKDKHRSYVTRQNMSNCQDGIRYTYAGSWLAQSRSAGSGEFLVSGLTL